MFRQTLYITAGIVLLLPCAVFSWGKAERPSIKKANRLYDKGLYDEAAKRYMAFKGSGQDSRLICFNLGNVFYKKGLYEQSLEYYQKASDGAADKTLKGAALYGRGNAYFRQGKLMEALAEYRSALEFLPADKDVLHNISVVERMIKEMAQKAGQTAQKIQESKDKGQNQGSSTQKQDQEQGSFQEKQQEKKQGGTQEQKKEAAFTDGKKNAQELSDDKKQAEAVLRMVPDSKPLPTSMLDDSQRHGAKDYDVEKDW